MCGTEITTSAMKSHQDGAACAFNRHKQEMARRGLWPVDRRVGQLAHTLMIPTTPGPVAYVKSNRRRWDNWSPTKSGFYIPAWAALLLGLYVDAVRNETVVKSLKYFRDSEEAQKALCTMHALGVPPHRLAEFIEQTSGVGE